MFQTEFFQGHSKIVHMKEAFTLVLTTPNDCTSKLSATTHNQAISEVSFLSLQSHRMHYYNKIASPTLQEEIP